jgi:Tfp pilus assembly protein PilN
VIKVNLLRDQTVTVRRTIIKPTVSQFGLLVAALFVVLVAALAGWWYYLDRQIQVATEKRDRLQTENLRLQALKKDLAQFEKLKQQRQRRIEVIEKLKEFQTGPVLLLNHVIRSIPRDSTLWLTALDQKADKILISGFAPRSESIPDFMSNLILTGFFDSVDLQVIQEEKDAAKFTLICAGKQKMPVE